MYVKTLKACCAVILMLIAQPLYSDVGKPQGGVLSLAGTMSFADGVVPLFGSISIESDAGFFQAVIDSEGRFSFYNLPEGLYSLLGHGVTEDRAGIYMSEGVEIQRSSSPVVIEVILVSEE